MTKTRHIITIDPVIANDIYDLANLNGITTDAVAQRIFKLGFLAAYGEALYVMRDGEMQQLEVFEKSLTNEAQNPAM